MASGLLLLAVAACASPPAASAPRSLEAPVIMSAPVADAAPALGVPPIEVAVTVDDLPAHGPLVPGLDRLALVDRLLAVFARHRLPPVYGFVNGKKVDDDPALEAVLRRWLVAGNPLGNHTWSHPSLNATSLRDYLGDVEMGEGVLRKLQADPAAWKLYRFPFLYEGDTAEKRDGMRSYLATHGYTVAEVSIDADDWAFSPPFARCSARGDGAGLAALRAEYVEVHVDELRRMHELGRLLVQREVRHVLLLHAGVADADAMETLLTAYEHEGVHWIDLPMALADPFYALDAGLPWRAGAAFPYRVARARGLHAAPPIYARGLEERLEKVCRE